MKKLIFALLIFAASATYAQTTNTIADNVNAKQSLTVNKRKITAIKNDSTLLDSATLLTAKAVKDFVTARVAAGGGGGGGSTDTSSLSSRINAKIDTAKLYGEYYNTTFPSTTLPSGMAKTNGSATYTQSSGMTVTGGNGNFSDNSLRNTDVSCSNNYDYIWEFDLTNKFTAHGQGKWFGKKSTNGSSIYNMYINFKYGGSSSLARATLSLVNGTGNGSVTDSSGTISMADGYKYRITVSQVQLNVIVEISRLVAGQVVESAFIYYKTSTNQGLVFPNVGVAAMGSLDATSVIKLTKFTINYNDIIYPNIAFTGTSISQGFMPSSMSYHWIEKAMKGSNHTWVNLGQGGNGWGDGILSLSQVFRLYPKVVVCELGVNDRGSSPATFRAYMQAYYDSCVAHSVQLVLVKDFSGSAQDTVYYNFTSEHPDVILIDAGAVLTVDDFVDGTHPNDNGNDKMASLCKRKIPLLFGTMVNNDGATLQADKDVKLTSLSDGDVLKYNLSEKLWKNGSLGTNYLQLQPGGITNQTGSAGVTEYLQVGTGAAIGNTVVGGTPLRVYENTADGQGIHVENGNAAYSFAPYTLVAQFGTNGGGFPVWQNTGIVYGGANGGLAIGAYNGPLKFQIGTSFTVRGIWNTTGLSIGTTAAPNASAVLDLVSTTQGLLMPRMTATQGSAVTGVDGLVIYVTSTNGTFTQIGFWGYENGAWVKF